MMKKLFLTTISILLIHALTAQDITPGQNGDLYSLEVGNVYFEVDASWGARISSFKINNDEVLHLSTGGDDNMWGSTLWTSPQSVWGWPPKFESLEFDAYTGAISENKIILTSATDPYNDLVFEKTFFANSADSSISIEYKIINEGSAPYELAAWEVARVPSGGLTYFPMGGGSVTGEFASETETIGDYVWYEHSSNDPSSRKFFSDGSDGWFAHVNEDNYLFLKVFEEDVAYGDAAPGEAEIELWYAGLTSYIELENQSEYVEIPAEDSYNYNLKWYLKEIGESVLIAKGSESLLNFTETVIFGIQDGKSSQPVLDMHSIYPNPAQDFITIRGAKNEIYSLKILDITGRTINKFSLLKAGEKINLESLNSGLYLYIMENGKDKYSGKLLVE